MVNSIHILGTIVGIPIRLNMPWLKAGVRINSSAIVLDFEITEIRKSKAMQIDPIMNRLVTPSIQMVKTKTGRNKATIHQFSL